MKKYIVALLFPVFMSYIFALDYRQVLFSNNYERIEKVNNSESIIKNHYETIIAFVKKNVDNSSQVSYEFPTFKYKELYSENYENGKLYRLLISDEPISQDKILNMSYKYIGQVVFIINNDILDLIDYNFFHYRGDHDGMWASSEVNVYEGIEVISRNNKIKGIMTHKSEVEVRTHVDEDGGRWTENKGFSNASYYEWNDLQNPKKYELVKNNVYLFDRNNNHIQISSTRPLIDKKRPLMYTIQNAFDGNPATAYVEDTSSSNIGITIKMKEERSLLQLSIINGYGENKDLYQTNNSIKELEIGNDYSTNEVLKLNNIFTLQKVSTKLYKNSSFCIFSRSLNSGSKYNDTCIAELNLFFKKFGWFIEE